jgi:integral membrane protein
VNRLLELGQPPLTTERVANAKRTLGAYRFMAFLTGVVLVSGCILLIFKYGTSVDVEPETGYVWIAHGWFYLIYVMVTATLGVRLRWPLPRFVLVMLAGTIPTMSFVAEHYVTRAVREATEVQPVPARD